MVVCAHLKGLPSLSKTMASTEGVQRTYAPSSICYGCGPANAHGLQIDSHREGDELVAVFRPEAHHHAFPGMVNGGIIGTLLDCHGNWAAAVELMDAAGEEDIPCTVTASYTVRLLRPTPMDTDLRVTARVTKIEGRKAWVDMALEAEGKRCAEGEGLFVAVKEGHPAYHRWS